MEYLTLAFSLYFIAVKARNKEASDGIYIFIAGLLILFSGLRLNLGGSDYFIYKKLFNAGTVDGSIPVDAGYLFLNNLARNIGFTYTDFLILIAIINSLILIYAWKRQTEYCFYSIFVYFCTVYPWHQLILIRQSIAISCFIVSLKYIKERKLIKFLVVMFVATLFHFSAIVLVPFYFIGNLRHTRRYFLFLTFALVGLIFLLNDYKAIVQFVVGNGLLKFFDKSTILETYLQNSNNGVSISYSIEVFAITLFAFLIEHGKGDENGYTTIYLNMLPFLLAFSLLGIHLGIFIRLADYFRIAYCVAIPYIVFNLRWGKAKVVFTLALLPYFIIKLWHFLVTFSASSYAYPLLPYNSIIKSMLSQLP